MKRLLFLVALLAAASAVVAQVYMTVKIRGNATVQVMSDLPQSGGGSIEAALITPLKVTGPGKVGHALYEFNVEKTGDTEWTVRILADGVPMTIQLQDWE